MPRDLPIGNGDLLVTFDHTGVARDLYYPYVGKYNHTTGQPQRFGVWADGRFAWLDDPAWTRVMAYRPDTLVTDATFEHKGLGIRLRIADCVDFHEPVWLRRVTVEDLGAAPGGAPAGADQAGVTAFLSPSAMGGAGAPAPGAPGVRDVRLFVHVDLSIQESAVGDTANFDPQTGGLVLYKNDFYFLLNGTTGALTPGGGASGARVGVDQWAIGTKRLHHAEGTWRDAEDGTLGKNAIAQGSVDATAAFHLRVPVSGSASANWWLVCGRDYAQVARVHRLIAERSPDKLFSRTEAYWKLWSTKEPVDLGALPGGGEGALARAYRRSLLVARTQIDNRGAIIAANDSDITHFAGDTYSYCWPRDGALVALAMARAGHSELSRAFFRSAAQWVTRHGYFLHKYTPDGKLASSWHPWQINGQTVLPIQQDETALVLWALRKHYEVYRDVEFIKPLYNALVIAPAKWMTDYRDAGGLPLPSWDLWEERRGVHTFTVAATIAALNAAGAFASDFGDTGRARWFEQAAASMLQALRAHLWNPQQRCFARMAHRREGAHDGAGGAYTLDMTRDAANFALWWLGVLPVDDPMIEGEMQAQQEALAVRTPVGGFARYGNDRYHAVTGEHDPHVPGNPWIICTLWQAQWRIARAGTLAELDRAAELMHWAERTTGPSGVMAEQVHPHTGAPLSVSPLTWSHATMALTTQEWLDRRRALLAQAQRADPVGAA